MITPTAMPEHLEEGRAQAPESRPLRRDADVLREGAASKDTRRRSEIKQTALRQSKDDDEHGKTRRTLPAVVYFYAPMFGVQDPEKDAGEDGASAAAHLETPPA